MSSINTRAVVAILTTCAVICTAQGVAAESIETVASYDSYSKATGIATDKFKVPDVGSFFSPAFAYAMLRGRVTDAGMESIELLIHYHDANDWKFYSSAVDSDGKNLPVQVIDRKILGGMGIDEDFSGIRIKRWTEWDDSDRFEPVDSGLLGGHRVLLKVFVFHD